MLKCIDKSCNPIYYYYYFKDENNNYYFWKTKSDKLEVAAYNEGRFLKPFKVIEWKLKTKNGEWRFYNNRQYQEIVVTKWEVLK